MLGDSFVLIIEDDEQDRAYLQRLFQFIGKQVITSSHEQALDDLEQAIARQQKLLCAVIGKIERNQYLPLIYAIDHCNSHLPILLIDSVATLHWPLPIRQRILQQIPIPLTYHSVIDALHRAYVYSDIYQPLSIGSPKLFSNLVGTSHAINQVREQLQKIADTEQPLLLLGEVGVGKEVVARNIHNQSLRRNQPFVVLDCAAVETDVIQALLFGYKQGLAVSDLEPQQGYLESADQGTLYLDEVSALPLTVQQQIAEVIKSSQFIRVGGLQVNSTNVRFMLADHADISALAKQGLFSSELFALVDPHILRVPALRQRLEDIPLLIHQLVARLEKNKSTSIRFNSGAIMALCQYSWPGNVRELANLVERMATLYPHGVIGLRELPDQYRGASEYAIEQQELIAALQPMSERLYLPEEGIDLRRYLVNLEQEIIEQALQRTSGVVAHAAELLGMGRTTLVEKMRKYHIVRKDT